MPRQKIRLTSRKHSQQQRKRRWPLQISLPLNLVKVQSAGSQITTSLFCAIKTHLQAHPAELPLGWAVLKSTPTKIVMSQSIVSSNSVECVTTFSLIIERDLFWKITLPGGYMIPLQSGLLNHYPLQIHNVHVIYEIINILNTSQICTGNQDEMFHELRGWKMGQFFSRGTYVYEIIIAAGYKPIA